jgi:hypothetical protein
MSIEVLRVISLEDRETAHKRDTFVQEVIKTLEKGSLCINRSDNHLAYSIVLRDEPTCDSVDFWSCGCGIDEGRVDEEIASKVHKRVIGCCRDIVDVIDLNNAS